MTPWMKRTLASALTLLILLTGCAQPTDRPDSPAPDGPSSGGEAPETPPVPAGPRQIAVCLGGEPDTLDPALNFSVEGGTILLHLFSGLARWTTDSDGTPVITAEAALALPGGTMNEDGSVTYTYHLRNGFQWSDGEDLTAEDFAFAWRRAAAADSYYSTLFRDIAGYDALKEPETESETEPAEPASDGTGSDGSASDGSVPEETAPPSPLAIEAPDERTLTVTLTREVPYWNELLASPAFLPVRADAAVSSDGWAASAETLLTNGPYTLKEWDHNRLIALEKNPDYPDADSVTMDKIEFYLSDDPREMMENYESGAWQMIDGVPVQELETLRTEHPDEFFAPGQMGTYYLSWNVNRELLRNESPLSGVEAEYARAEIRNAVNLLLDRTYLTEEVARGGQVPAASLVPLGVTAPDGTQFCESAGNSGSFPGYYDVNAAEENYGTALETLKKYYTFDEETQSFTDFPPLSFLYNSGEGHRAVAEYVRDTLAAVGIPVSLEELELSPFLYARRTGGYGLVRGGLMAECNDPLYFLEQWTSDAAGNDAQLGRGAHAGLGLYSLDLIPFGYEANVENGTWAETYDVLIEAARYSRNPDTRNTLCHMAEDQLLSTGCVVPLFFYTDVYLLHSSVHGFYSVPQGYKFFRSCVIYS